MKNMKKMVWKVEGNCVYTERKQTWFAADFKVKDWEIHISNTLLSYKELCSMAEHIANKLNEGVPYDQNCEN